MITTANHIYMYLKKMKWKHKIFCTQDHETVETDTYKQFAQIHVWQNTQAAADIENISGKIYTCIHSKLIQGQMLEQGLK